VGGYEETTYHKDMLEVKRENEGLKRRTMEFQHILRRKRQQNKAIVRGGISGIGSWAVEGENDDEAEAVQVGTSARSSKQYRITKAFSRSGSTQEATYPGYQVYDSTSTYSASSSISSIASAGRRGPLSGAARAMANAVKAVKACWRCKFLRKPVTSTDHA
jgi:hypothetical protein